MILQSFHQINWLHCFDLTVQRLSPGLYKAIEIYEGEEAIGLFATIDITSGGCLGIVLYFVTTELFALTDQPGVVASLSAPLYEAGVELIYLSTYNTDLILVLFVHV